MARFHSMPVGVEGGAAWDEAVEPKSANARTRTRPRRWSRGSPSRRIGAVRPSRRLVYEAGDAVEGTNESSSHGRSIDAFGTSSRNPRRGIPMPDHTVHRPRAPTDRQE